MKKVLISAFVLVFVLGISFAYADENCASAKKDASCASKCAKAKAETQSAASVSQKSETKVEDPHAGCPMHGEKAKAEVEAQKTETEAQIETEKIKIEAKQAEIAKTEAGVLGAEMKVAEAGCPEVAEHSPVFAFHERMHPMHMALEDAKYDEVRQLYPDLKKASKGLKSYQCPTGADAKCSKECKKEFKAKKSALLKAVDKLGKAVKRNDNAKIDETFGVMHEAYIQFASCCSGQKTMEVKEAKTKIEKE